MTAQEAAIRADERLRWAAWCDDQASKVFNPEHYAATAAALRAGVSPSAAQPDVTVRAPRFVNERNSFEGDK